MVKSHCQTHLPNRPQSDLRHELRLHRIQVRVLRHPPQDRLQPQEPVCPNRRVTG